MVATALTEAEVWSWLSEVPDPEIPVLTIVDLGIVRDVTVDDGVTVAIAPTYSGCPATEVIEASVRSTLVRHGVAAPNIERTLSPAWTTDWITQDGKRKMREYGIAPPQRSLEVACPQCDSTNTEKISEFGSTACKASWRCRECLEPFEYFKCL